MFANVCTYVLSCDCGWKGGGGGSGGGAQCPVNMAGSDGRVTVRQLVNSLWLNMNILRKTLHWYVRVSRSIKGDRKLQSVNYRQQTTVSKLQAVNYSL